jgi:hypothetical protein
MASPEEALNNLRQFCAVLASTNEKLEGTVDALGSHSDAYGDLDHTAQDEIGGLGDDLVTHAQQVRQAGDDAVAEVGHVTDSARATADTRLGQEDADLDGAENEFDQRLDADGSDLDAALAALNDTGFDPLAGIMADAGVGVQETGQENAQSSGWLVALAADMERRAADLEGDTSRDLDEVGEKLKGDETGQLESGAAEAIDAWTTQIPGEVTSEGSTIAEALEQLYQDWASSLETAGDELMQALTDFGNDSATRLEDDGGTPLQEAVDHTTGTEMAALDVDLEQTKGVLATGLELGLTVPPVVADLVIVKNVIDQIQKLLEAL